MHLGLVAERTLWHAARAMIARIPRPLAAASLAFLLAGCATVPGQDRLAARDPLEKVNRALWNVNMAADRIIVKPVTQGYRAVAPRPVRQGVTNFFSNLTEPWSLVNNLLQGKPKRAGQNLKRFLVNSTVGIAGLFDRATKMGIQPAPEDLGQTLAVWGVNGGPYLVLPLLGPTTLRDGVGSAGAFVGDPVSIAINQSDVGKWPKRGYRAVQIIDARSELIESGGDAFLKSSLDPYAAARSAYLQRRRAQIGDQEDAADTGAVDDPMSGDATDGDTAATTPAQSPPAETVPTPVGDPATAPEPAVHTPGQDTTPPPEPVAPPRP